MFLVVCLFVLFAVCCLLFVVCRMPIAVRSSLIVAGCNLFVVGRCVSRVDPCVVCLRRLRCV